MGLFLWPRKPSKPAFQRQSVGSRADVLDVIVEYNYIIHHDNQTAAHTIAFTEMGGTLQDGTIYRGWCNLSARVKWSTTSIRAIYRRRPRSFHRRRFLPTRELLLEKSTVTPPFQRHLLSPRDLSWYAMTVACLMHRRGERKKELLLVSLEESHRRFQRHFSSFRVLDCVSGQDFLKRMLAIMWLLRP
jgi:hypothetical protein